MTVTLGQMNHFANGFMQILRLLAQRQLEPETVEETFARLIAQGGYMPRETDKATYNIESPVGSVDAPELLEGDVYILRLRNCSPDRDPYAFDQFVLVDTLTDTLSGKTAAALTIVDLEVAAYRQRVLQADPAGNVYGNKHKKEPVGYFLPLARFGLDRDEIRQRIDELVATKVL